MAFRGFLSGIARRTCLPMFVVASLGVPLVAGTLFAFKGRPTVKISEGGVDRVVEKLTRQQGNDSVCMISEEDGKFFWASRDNQEMVPYVTGSFTTYIAANGAGYVRIINPGKKETTAILGPTEAAFDYVEHHVTGLHSETYFGVATEK